MQFNRQAEVILGNKKYHSDDFDFEFEVEFDDTPNLNHAEITLYNLSDTTVNSIKSKMLTIINAGYGGDVGSVFIGAIYDMQTERSGVDRVTTVKSVDVSTQRGRLRVNRSYKKGIRASQIITDLTGLYAMSLGALELPKDVQYRNGKNINGNVMTVFKSIAKDCGAKLHVTKGLVYFNPKNKGQDIRFVFNKDTGLIGSPEPFIEEDPEDEEKEIKGFNVNALLNHRVQADSIVEVQSNIVTGRLRVRGGTHIYSASEMVTRMEVV